MKKRVLVFASGSASGGGSGFKNLVMQGWNLHLPYEVVGVITHHADGGVVEKANQMGITCHVVSLPVTAEDYRRLVAEFEADLIALSGWLKPVTGLPTEKVINIHPGLFGLTSGLHGHAVHERMIKARDEDGTSTTYVTMHFVTPFVKKADGTTNYDTGPVFAEIPVEILREDTAETLGARVNAMEHKIQPALTALVAEGCIKMGIIPNSVPLKILP